MRPQAFTNIEYSNRPKFTALLLICVILGFAASCSELEKPKAEEFYSESKPPRSQEFRWTNGQMPKSFDPAKASAPPETDLARALYEGLTDSEQKTLKPIPAIAKEWTSSKDAKVWTFKLRRDAKWSNGKPVIASDFVRSWSRLAKLGEDLPHHELLKNIVGMVDSHRHHDHKDRDVFSEKKAEDEPPARQDLAGEKVKSEAESTPKNVVARESNSTIEKRRVKERHRNLPSLKKTTSAKRPQAGPTTKVPALGIEAVNDYELRVKLLQPDKDFPKLVAHPIFRPVYADGREFEKEPLSEDIVTSGAFDIVSVSSQGIELKRSELYWNSEKIKLEKVVFVPTKDADGALKAYRDGRVDAVTNAQFEPLALKLLTPYFDFRRVTHSALNLYEFNRQKAPFNDRRVREALALAIEREKLTDDEMDGATKPANKYLPFGSNDLEGKFEHDVTKARDLLEKAGFSNGADFPTVRLVVNRNNVQKKIARSVAKMWEKDLNIKTEIVVKELAELETAKRDGDFDILRRGVVMPTADETANMLAIFKPVKLLSEKRPDSDSDKTPESAGDSGSEKKNGENSKTSKSEGEDTSAKSESEDLLIDVGADDYILTESEALTEVPGIPLYFPTSYSLVKPYVIGFEMNTLDAPSLKEVAINSNWQPESAK